MCRSVVKKGQTVAVWAGIESVTFFAHFRALAFGSSQQVPDSPWSIENRTLDQTPKARTLSSQQLRLTPNLKRRSSKSCLWFLGCAFVWSCFCFGLAFLAYGRDLGPWPGPQISERRWLAPAKRARQGRSSRGRRRESPKRSSLRRADPRLWTPGASLEGSAQGHEGRQADQREETETPRIFFST